jgi:hypothetical protein
MKKKIGKYQPFRLNRQMKNVQFHANKPISQK